MNTQKIYPVIRNRQLIEKLGIKGDLIDLPKRDELTRNVIYFLFDRDEIVYIGKSQDFNVYTRVKYHKSIGRTFDSVSIMPIYGEDVKNIITIEEDIINSTDSKYNTYRVKKEQSIQASRKRLRNYLKNRKCNQSTFNIQKL